MEDSIERFTVNDYLIARRSGGPLLDNSFAVLTIPKMGAPLLAVSFVDSGVPADQRPFRLRCFTAALGPTAGVGWPPIWSMAA